MSEGFLGEYRDTGGDWTTHQHCIPFAHNDNLTDSDVYYGQMTDRCIGILDNGATTFETYGVGSIEDDGFRITVTDPATRYICYLAEGDAPSKGGLL